MPTLTGDRLTIEVNDPSTPSTSITVTVGAAGAAAAATSVPVTALASALPIGTVLVFTGGKTVTLTAAAAAAAVTLTTTAVPAGGLAAGNTATGYVAPTLWLPVNDMNRFSRRGTRSTSRTRVFMRARPYLTRGQRETTATVSGLINNTDPGQNALRTAFNVDTIVTLRILPDGTNGFLQDFYVNNSGSDSAPDPQDLQDTSFELSDASDPLAIGTGPVV